MKCYKSGEYAPKAGTYKVKNKSGKTMNEVELKSGDTFPPTQTSGCHYEI